MNKINSLGTKNKTNFFFFLRNNKLFYKDENNLFYFLEKKIKIHYVFRGEK